MPAKKHRVEILLFWLHEMISATYFFFFCILRYYPTPGVSSPVILDTEGQLNRENQFVAMTVLSVQKA